MKRISIVITFFAFSLFSCTEDESNSSINEITFDQYTVETTSKSSTLPHHQEFITGNIVNNKKYSITTSEAQTTQQYFYSGNQLISTVFGEQITTFYYDAHSHLIGSTEFLRT